MASRTWAITAGAVLVAVVLLVLTGNSLEDNDSYGSIAAALVAIGTAYAGIVLFLSREQRPEPAEQEADALASELLAQWEPEIRHRRQRFGDQRLIPLGWTGTDIGAVRLRLDGRMEGNPDAAAARLADGFDQLPSKRLVVIGKPGAGKTFLGVMLTVGLLHRRASNAPVPVFLSLSSWDPVEDSLDEWLVRTLAGTYYNGRHQVAKTLLARRLLLPILDGLDELPEHARRRAVNRLNDALDGDRPLVLTCRAAEYDDLIAAGAPSLLRAPVVRINPVRTADVTARLRNWPGIATHVERAPDGPLATALSTPLMLSLFTAAYRERSPDELLTARFASRHAVEDHLVDLLVDTVYPDPKHRRWLTYLAEVLHREDDRDLRWWELARRTLSPWTAPVLGLLVAAVVFTIAVALYWTPGGTRVIVIPPPQLAALFGVAVTLLWMASSGRAPGPTAGSRRRGFLRGVLTGSALVLAPGVPLLLLMTSALDPDPMKGPKEAVPIYGGALLALAAVAGIGVGLHELLSTRTSRSGSSGPKESLRHDRRSSLASAAITGLAVGTLTPGAALLGGAFGAHLGQRLLPGESGARIVTLDLPPLRTYVPLQFSWDVVPAFLVNSLLIAVLFATAVLTTRAWPRFVVARTALALAGRLPWSLMRFLADAREHGLLRAADGGYQFWHARLQERLVMTAEHRARTRLSRPLVAGLGVAPAVIALVVVWSAEPEDCARTGWSEVDGRMARVTYQDTTGCFATVAHDGWQVLQKRKADGALLAKIAEVRPEIVRRDYDQVALAGDFGNIDPVRWQEILRGVASAQEIGERPLVVDFAYSDTGVQSSDRHAALLWQFLTQTTGIQGDGSAVSLDATTSTVFAGVADGPRPVIGLRDPDPRALAPEFAGAKINQFLGPRPVETPPVSPADGISDGECGFLRRYSYEPNTAMNLDLRGVEPSRDLLSRLAGCGYVRVVVDEQYAGQVRAMSGRPATVDVLFVEYGSAGITADCRARLSTPTEVATCVAVLTAAEDGRVRLKVVE
ncbi:NACHT domain-containing protein [Lentzea sp. NPDC051838]|uniref:NACHT domain-containing protein n=1 Tax=Lentzea sp. NPDC051838 TaxID=3154849 RepID=UPI0034343408